MVFIYSLLVDQLCTIRCEESGGSKGYFLRFIVLRSGKGGYLCANALQPFDCIYEHLKEKKHGTENLLQDKRLLQSEICF